MIALWRSLLAIARSSAARPLIAAASALVLMVAALSVSACSRRPPNATPDGAVRELVERMQRVQGDPADAKAAYMLLSKRAQSNLAERSVVAKSVKHRSGGESPAPR